MRMYERYIDDSNLVAKVPINGSKYDKDIGLVVFDEQEVRDDEMVDERLARLLKDVANYVQQGINMEADFPSGNVDRKIARRTTGAKDFYLVQGIGAP